MVQRRSSVWMLGVPLDLGANVRGANIGPAALRIAGIHDKVERLGYTVEDKGDVAVPVRETIERRLAEQRYLPLVRQICDDVRLMTREALAGGHIAVTLGGDHSLAVGSVTGVSEHYRDRGGVGLIWVDAHGDLNTPSSSPTGNLHGMPLSSLLGEGHDELTLLGGARGKVRPENVALVGIRTLDDAEKAICKRSGVRYFTMREIDERGMAAVMREAIETASRGTAALHVSFDLDAVDPVFAPGVSTPEAGGLSYREAHLALEMVADTQKLAAFDLVELNPITDHAHQTAVLAIELLLSALGKAIV